VSRAAVTEKGTRRGSSRPQLLDGIFAQEPLLDSAQSTVGAQARMYGQRIHLLRDVLILAGRRRRRRIAELDQLRFYVPRSRFFADQQWSHITDWRAD